MRKLLYFVSLLLLTLLMACGSNQERHSEDNPDGTEASAEEPVNPAEGESVENKEDEEETNQNKQTDKTEKEDELDAPSEQIAQYRVSDDWSLQPIEEGTNENVVLLTFDDAPDTYALEIAKKLKELGAGAIFFVNGHFLESTEKQEVLKQIHDMGFLIGNHTYSHAYLPDLSEEEQRNEIIRVNDMVEKIIGERPKFFRAPNGANTDYTKQIAKDEKMVLMNWSYGYDFFKPYMDKEKLTEAMITGEGPEAGVNYSLLKPGANLLMHDRDWTNEAIIDIVQGLRDKGYDMVDPHLIETIK